MPRVTCVLDKESYEKIEKKATSFGLKTSAYLRLLVTANLKRDEETLTLKDIQKSVKALLPPIVELISRSTQMKDAKVQQRTTDFLLEMWEKEMQKNSP